MIKAIENLYDKFFNEFGIDPKNGVLSNHQEVKFATMPYIGSRYIDAKKKILFVGMDIGKDEAYGSFQSLADRRVNIELDKGYNPHIAGTYATALYLLKYVYGWENVWNQICTGITYTRATKVQNHKDGENPLSYVALTNLHKFVTVERENRSGSKDRVFIDNKIEENMLLREIELLKPQIVLFQGTTLKFGSFDAIKNMGIEIIKAYHPSNRLRGCRQPLNYIKTFRIVE